MTLVKQKIAGFLDFLFPKDEPPASNAARKKALEQAAQRVSREFQRGILYKTSEIGKQLDRIALKHGVDPSYVRLIFIRPTRFWPMTLTGKDKQALHLANKITGQSGALPSVANAQMPPAAVEYKVDAALVELARWAKTKLIPGLQDMYYAEILPRQVNKANIKILRRPDSKIPALWDAGEQISGYFKHRLRSGETSPHRLLMWQVLNF